MPSSRASRQPRPNRRCAATAAAAAVTNVPATPIHTVAVAAVRNFRQPMCIPPSNRMNASATLTTRWTVPSLSRPKPGNRSDAAAANTRKNAGAGIRSRSLTRFDSTAAVPTSPMSKMARPNDSVPVTGRVLSRSGDYADQTSRHPSRHPNPPSVSRRCCHHEDMRLTPGEARERLGAARVARLATVSATGQPHLVPVTFAVDGDMIYTAVDHKPKTTTRLRRLANIAANPQVTLLADHYADDWDQLWWARADGHATVLTGPADIASPVALLAARYPQYQATPPAGPVIAITVTTWTAWSYT